MTGTAAHAASRRNRRRGAPLWFLVPGIVLYAVIVLAPSTFGAGLSFTDATIGTGGGFVGLDNYLRIFGDDATVAPLAHTLIMAIAITVLQNVFGLLIALALNSAIKSRNILRVVFFAPFVVSPLVAGFLWKYILAPDGPLNQALGAIGLDVLQRPWLGEPGLALASLVGIVVWQFTGSTMVIYLAGLQGVPREVLEAAELDGAVGFRRFWAVVRPFLAPAITVNLTLSLISGLRLYDQIVAMTNGGPGGATDSLSTVIYRVALQFGEFGYGAALAVMLTIFVIILSGAQYLGLRRQSSAS
ncbi:sugar ABC transporter permease [Nonomuraea sp. NPDC005650]|uniref:carbohydrate ABC transporter permease n=1 Tax=Nonomuraea sp. NPDC005650 TaxID=3157045 RepID=UPI0033A5EB51